MKESIEDDLGTNPGCVPTKIAKRYYVFDEGLRTQDLFATKNISRTDLRHS